MTLCATQYAYLDDNGVWQAAPSASTNYAGTAGTTAGPFGRNNTASLFPATWSSIVG